MITLILTFAKFCLLASPLLLFALLITLWIERQIMRRKVRRMKRNFREAYQDWKNGNAQAHRFAVQWHHRLSMSGR